MSFASRAFDRSPRACPRSQTSADGMVLPSERAVGEGRAFRTLFPSESARLLGASFQGETKKAEVLLFPLRWDGSGLVLSRRLVVRLDFVGREAAETSLGGSTGRRAVASRPGRIGRGLAAQLVAKERGLYALAYEDVFENRAQVTMSAAVLRLSRQGEDVAFHVEPDPTLFAPGSTLYFVSEGSELNPYGDAVYELETGTAGTRMPVDLLSVASPFVDEYYATVRREENKSTTRRGFWRRPTCGSGTCSSHLTRRAIRSRPIACRRRVPRTCPSRCRGRATSRAWWTTTCV